MVPNVGVDPRRGTPFIDGSVPRVGNRDLFNFHVARIAQHTGESDKQVRRELARENRGYRQQAEHANAWNNHIEGRNK